MEYVGFPSGLKQTDKKVKKWIKDWTSSDKLRLIVKDKKTNKPIGETGYRIDKNYPFSKLKTVALDIKLIPSFWRKGLGTEALEKIIKYIFEETDNRIVQVTPNIKNKKAIKLYKKLGFKKKGKTKVCNKTEVPVKYQYMELRKK